MSAVFSPVRIALGLLYALSLNTSQAVQPAHPAPSFNKQIQPILDANCVACHQTGSAQQGLVLESGLSFGNLTKSSTEVPALKLIQAGAPDASYAFRKLSNTHLEAGGRGARMPLGGELASEDLEAIRRWIAAGARNN